MDAIGRLNTLPADQAETEFLKCCGSKRWASAITAERPFNDADDLIAAADRIWWALEPDDWLEAFRSHPKIGEKKAQANTSKDTLKWSESEQSGTRRSSEQTMDELARLNRRYEEKFGFIFIVCATGKSADEMLKTLQERLTKDPEQEIRNAAAEQAKITALRLNKLIESYGDV